MKDFLKSLENFPHEKYMRIALNQAILAMEKGETPTGCVIIHIEPSCPPRIIGRAHNQVELLKDPTAHAEMIAITQAASEIGDWRLLNTILYVTKEPCAMCAGAIVLARVPMVVYGTPDPLRGGATSLFNILHNPKLNHQCTIIKDVLAKECLDLLQSFFREKRGNKS